MDIEFKQSLIDALYTLPVCNPNTSRTQYVTRCPYCGDSSNQSHGHFSIKIDLNTDTPILYRCFKCDESGLFDESVADELGLSLDSNMLDNLKSYNRKVSKKHNLFDADINNLYVPKGNSSYTSNLKLEYISNRLGIDMTYEKARDYKIITDIFEFMNSNKIYRLDNATDNQLKFINHNYVGFLSTNNNLITFRNITNNEGYRRYYKLILDNHNTNKSTFYSIPNSFDLMYTNEVNVHIGEGTFDIISVKENVIKETKDNFYYASCGYGYITILKYMISKGLNTGISLYIYSDNDKTDYDHMKYLFRSKGSFITPWIDKIVIRRNGYEKEKDFGVRPDRIKKIERIIK